MIDLLPQEILLEVFDYLPSKDLLALTLTLKSFDETISSSNHLSRRLEVHFVSEHKALTWSGARKHSKFYLEGSPAKYFLPIFREIHADVIELCITCVRMEATVFKEILLLCKNLKKLTIKNNRIAFLEDFVAPLPCLNLDTLHYRNFTDQSTKIFNLLMGCQTKELIVFGFTSSCVELRRFMNLQKKLEIFCLKDANRKTTLFDDQSITGGDFRLKKLTLDCFSIGCENSEARLNFQGFLDNHRGTLTHLTINDMSRDVLDFFINFKRLKFMKIIDVEFNVDCPSLSMVENLTIGFEATGCWAEKFPSVRNLTMTWIQYKKDLIQVGKLKKLERLRITNCCIPELSIPTVKTLTLADVGFADRKPFSGTKIEELIIENCTTADWLAEFLSQDDKKINLLRISKTKVSRECMRIIERRRHKIKSLQIVK